MTSLSKHKLVTYLGKLSSLNYIVNVLDILCTIETKNLKPKDFLCFARVSTTLVIAFDAVCCCSVLFIFHLLIVFHMQVKFPFRLAAGEFRPVYVCPLCLCVSIACSLVQRAFF